MIGCIPIDDEASCTSLLETCETPQDTEDFAQNNASVNSGAIIGSVLGIVVAAAAVLALLYLAKMGKGPLYFQAPDIDADPAAYNNPLYQEYAPRYENPIYEAPKDFD